MSEVMAVAGARFFQFYLDNYFNFPKEIKNDIIYCQRAFHAHLKVHQLIVSKIKAEDGYSADKKRILKELEDEMILINGEQNFLLLRLRRVIDEFYKSVERGGIPIDVELTNQLIFREVGPHIHDTSTDIKPVSVHFYNTEEKLMEKYSTFIQHRNNVPDKVEDGSKLVASSVRAEKKSQPISGGLLLVPAIRPQQQQQHQQTKPDYSVPLHSASNGVYPTRNSNHLSQVSLLKPISQRMLSQLSKNFIPRSLYPEPTITREAHASTSYGRKTPYELPRNSNVPSVALPIKEEPIINLPVSKNVTLSRLNLQQALKKAKTDTLAAKASANILTKPVATNAAAPTLQPVQRTVLCHPNAAATLRIKPEPKPPKIVGKANLKMPAINNVATRTVKTRAPSTSSEDLSATEREPTPPIVSSRGEEEVHKTQPEDYGQEMFLRIFDLVTPEMQIQMQQRRSKRRRRTVHNNERADFHYGRIEHMQQPSDDKHKNKAFLLSPQAKRPKKSRQKRDSDEPSSRSGTSSPEERRACNQCLKRRGSVDQCDECKGFYHQSCHSPSDAKDTKNGVSTLKRSLPVAPAKCCPACSRLQMNLIKKEKEQNATLNSTVKELEHKIAAEKQRRSSLQHTSKFFKTQMRKLFNIVNTFKSDNEFDSSD